MEVKNDLVQCPQGHFYNASLHSSCPYCGSSEGTIAFGGNDAAQGGYAPGSTVSFSGGGGDFSPTESPSISAAGGIGKGSSGGMFAPTMVGGDLQAGTETAPVVGWLVCVDGPVKGTDYRIHAGYNYIGREEGDIHIHGDLQISRQNHAMVAYDSSECTYYVGPSAGRNLIKVNGKTVLNAVEITNYDIISIGTTKLMFVALCGEHFDWNRENKE